MNFEFERYTDLGEFGEHLLVVKGKILDEPDRQVSAVLLSVIVYDLWDVEISEILPARIRLRFEDELVERYLEQKTD